jgi:hypothetical protein
MLQICESRKALVGRLAMVAAYLSTDMAVTSFARLYNTGGVRRDLLGETGPVDPEDLDRWADACVEALKEEEDG